MPYFASYWACLKEKLPVFARLWPGRVR